MKNLFYDYTYERLAHKRYSNIVENNVTYTYGGATAGTGRGRLVRVEDGTGVRTLEYDALGNVGTERRTIAVPGSHNVYTFTTGYRYDSWGRMRSMTYPDGETVTYTYGYGGDLRSMYGDKGTEHHDYVLGITYNDYGQRSHILYGNGTSADYTYDALHRLSMMHSVSASGVMQRIRYATDGAGNIARVGNDANAIGTLGGQYDNHHHYDALDRLSGSAATDNAYHMAMGYSPAGRIAMRRVASHGTYPMDIVAHYGYCRDRQPHAPRRIFDENANVLTDLVWDEAGNLGQVNTVRHDVYDGTRFLFWTEDSRLHHAVDGRYYSYYAYDHTGERTIKLTGTNTVVDVNARLMETVGVSRIVLLFDCVNVSVAGASALTQSRIPTFPHSRIRCIRGLGWDDGVLRRDIPDAPGSLKTSSTICLNNFGSNMSYYSAQTVPEDYVYFYHGDHLGGANWITDAHGVPVQHLQYLPFGERYIDQRAAGSTYHERYTFTGKEKDEETGYGYYGARYMDHELMTMWLGVDPMADKYPSISPYAYCVWNPVKLVDPDGREIHLTFTSKKAFEVLNKIINDGLGGQFKATYTRNDDDSYTLSLSPTEGGGDKSKLTERQLAFYNELSDCINGTAVAEITVVFGSRLVHNGNYTTNKIDVADIFQYDDMGQGACTKQGKLTHEFVEQYYKAAYGHEKGVGLDMESIHRNYAIPAENHVNGTTRRDLSFSRGIVSQSFIDISGNATDYHYSTRDAILKVRKCKHGVR